MAVTALVCPKRSVYQLKPRLNAWLIASPNRNNNSNNVRCNTNCTCLATLTTAWITALIDHLCLTSRAISVTTTACIFSLPKCRNKFVVATDPNMIINNSIDYLQPPAAHRQQRACDAEIQLERQQIGYYSEFEISRIFI